MKSISVATSPEPMKIGAIQPRAPMPGAQLAEARQRLPINILSNMIWLVLNVVVGLWYTPYLISHLGVGVYGLVPLASSVTSYMSILTTGLGDAISRFLTIDLTRGDAHAANRTFNTAIVGSLSVVAILFPISLLASWFAPQVLNVPLGSERSAQWLVLLSAVAFLSTTFASSFAVSSYALHRFDLRLLVNIVRLVAQSATVVVLFSVLPPSPWQVGIGILVSATLFLLGHGVLWRKLTPQLMVRLSLFERSHLKQFLEFSGWVLVNMVGATLFLNIDLIVANVIFGPSVAGRYGSVAVFPIYLRTLVSSLSGVVGPIALTLYAQDDLAGLARFCRLAVKLIGLTMALPIGLLIGLGRPLLTVWLGPEFADLSWLLVALVGHLCINVAVLPLFSLQVVTNNVRVPGLVTLAMGVANAGLAVALALWSGWGYVGIAIAGAIVLTAKNTLFTPLHGARILKSPWWTFLPSLAAGTLGCLVVAAGTYWIAITRALTGWGHLVLVAVIASGIYVVVVGFFGLGTDDRRLLLAEIERRRKR